LQPFGLERTCWIPAFAGMTTKFCIYWPQSDVCRTRSQGIQEGAQGREGIILEKAVNHGPLIRPSATFSPQAGRRERIPPRPTLSPTLAARGESAKNSPRPLAGEGLGVRAGG
jgi:hypothetical protein